MSLVSRAGVGSVALAAAFGCAAGWAQTPSVVLTEPAAPLLPRQFGGWTMDGAATRGTSGTEPGEHGGRRAWAIREAAEESKMRTWRFIEWELVHDSKSVHSVETTYYNKGAKMRL